MNKRDPVPLGYFSPFQDQIDPFVAAPEPERPTDALPIISAASLAGKKVPPRLFVVPGMIPDRTVTILAGDGGVGKSTLIKQLGVSVSAGALWLGETTARGPVIDVSAEDDLDEQHRRLAAIAPAMGVDLADLTDLHLVPLAGLDAVMGSPDSEERHHSRNRRVAPLGRPCREDRAAPCDSGHARRRVRRQ